MKVKHLKEVLQNYDDEDDILSIEADDWQWHLIENAWKAKYEYEFSDSGSFKVVVLKNEE